MYFLERSDSKRADKVTENPSERSDLTNTPPERKDLPHSVSIQFNMYAQSSETLHFGEEEIGVSFCNAL